MARRRSKENDGLPKRWRFYHGAYYYQVPPGKEADWDGKKQFRLGRSLSEAHRTFADRVEDSDAIRTMAQLIDRYAQEVTPTKASRTQSGEWAKLKLLREIFGHSSVVSIRPQDCYRIRDVLTRQRGPTTANRHLETLSHLFTKAIEWGVIGDHPIKGKVLKNKLRPQRHVPDDWEIDAALSVAPSLIRCYVDLKLLTGLRMTDMLSLKWSDIRHDGIHVTPSKTANSSRKSLIIQWDDDGHLRGVIDDIRRLRRPIGSVWLFCTRYGQPYVKDDGSCNAFQSIWQRWMKKALSQTDLEHRFSERSLRTKVGSESASDQEAADRLGHSTVQTARRHYREKPTVVTPLVRKKSRNAPLQ